MENFYSNSEISSLVCFLLLEPFTATFQVSLFVFFPPEFLLRRTSSSFPQVGYVLPPLDSLYPGRGIILDGTEDNVYGT